MTTITGFVSTTVTLGYGNYNAPLYISATGGISPLTYGAAALISVGPGYYINNQGFVQGGLGFVAFAGHFTAGGAGVLLSAGSLANTGLIKGGYGGSSYFYAGGPGGVGIDVSFSTVTNAGTMAGGDGGNGIGVSGNGGYGVVLDVGASDNFYNNGIIAGGAGGAGNKYSYNSETNTPVYAGDGGNGGTGLVLATGTLTNSLTIYGGAGGQAGAGGKNPGGQGGNGGLGALMPSGFLYNYGSVTGGQGGQGAYADSAGSGGQGGAGVLIGNGLLENHGSMTGGQGGAGGYAGGSSGAPPGDGGNGGAGIVIGGGTVQNDGTITGGQGGAIGGSSSPALGGSAGSGAYGVSISGGTLTNDGSIVGGASGGYRGQGGGGAYLTGGTLINDKSILGGAGSGLYSAGGVGALVYGGTLINNGTITAGGAGSPNVGVRLDGGTLIDAGTIDGYLSGDAVLFGNVAATLTVDPGAAFTGGVIANGSVDDVLRLAGATPGSLSGIGTAFENFTGLGFAPGAQWTVDGTADGFSAIGTITGLSSGDTIVIDNFVESGFTYADGELVIDDAADPVTLNIGTGYTQSDFDISTNGTDTTVEIVCFLRGTRILTPAGETQVENLRIGDLVSTLTRGLQPIRWIGTGKVMVPAGHRCPATPVIVRRGALAPNVPHRDLRITKGHALFLDGAFIPAEFLVNHRSILWDDAAREVEFYHIELDSHEVLLADGAPSESYRDDGNRWLFRNANPAWDRPGIAPHAPILTGGPKLDAIWSRLLNRSGDRLHLPTTTDPDLHLLVDSARVDARRRDGNVVIFPLPPKARSVIIASRAAAQDELGRARDPRRLGVAISRVELHGAAGRIVLDAASLAGPGFYPHEPLENCTWTNGRATLPTTPCCARPAQALHIHLRHTTHYALRTGQLSRAA